MVTKFINHSDNLRIAYIENKANASNAEKPTVLYLGGFCSSMMGTKASLLADWSAKHGVNFLRFDYRGNGESDGEFLHYGIDHWIADAALVIDKLIKGPVILVGSSMGGWIGAALSKNRGSRIGGFEESN